MTRALVLSGGGVKGAFQVGALMHSMGDLGRDYDIVCGVSVGALNAAGLCNVKRGMPSYASSNLRQFWEHEVSSKAIYRRWFPFGRLHSLWKKSVYDSSPLRKLIQSHVDHEKIQHCGTDIVVGAVCLNTGEMRYVTQKNENFIDWIIASASFPIFFEPVEIDGQLWSDGGINNITPLGQAIRMGATEIDVIVCSPRGRQGWRSMTKRAVPDQIMRTFDLMSGCIADNDLHFCELKNDQPTFKHIAVNVIAPEVELTDNSLDFSRYTIAHCINAGYESALKTFSASLARTVQFRRMTLPASRRLAAAIHRCLEDACTAARTLFRLGAVSPHRSP